VSRETTTGAVANWRRLVAIPSWAWLILEGFATIGWLIAIAWGCFRIVRWLFG